MAETGNGHCFSITVTYEDGIKREIKIPLKKLMRSVAKDLNVSIDHPLVKEAILKDMPELHSIL